MLYVEPAAGDSPILSIIQQARREIDLNVYFLDSRPIISALEAAKRRGVRVEVILDGKPYRMSPWKVRKEFATLKQDGIQVRAAPARFERQYVFDHAKYVCNGHACEIGTANFDWSAFHKNREYLYVTANPRMVTAARDVFHADWSNRPAGAGPRRYLVLSPGSESKLAAVIGQPGKVDIETEEMGDDRAILDAIAAKGNQAWVIVPGTVSRQDRKNLDWLKTKGVHIGFMPRSDVYLHAKMIAGNAESFIGSENFSDSSLNRNREMGVLLTGAPIRQLEVQFNADWKAVDVGDPQGTVGRTLSRWADGKW